MLNQKSFKAKTGIKKLPDFKSEEEQPQRIKEDGKQGENRSLIYGEYLEQLCEADFGQRSHVVIPPSNLELTANTPIIQDAEKLMKGLLECMDSLEEKERQLLEEIKQLDLLNSDRLHMIEMYELTDAECVTLIHDLHRAQIERRRRKNDLLAITAEKNVLRALDKSGLRRALAAIKGFDNRRAGECRVEVQYQGLADSFTVDIIPQKLLGITISQMPSKTDYAPGDMFDKDGLVVLGFYDSGQLLPLRSFLIEPDRPLQESDIAVLVTSMDKTAVIPIKVGEMFRSKPEQPREWTFPGDGDGWNLPADTGAKPETVVPDLASGPLPGDQVFPDTKPDSGPETPKKKESRFWSGKLFYPSFAKHREE